MSKTLETKKRILSLLRSKDMTISELSRELALSTATISQHLDELHIMGAIEKVDNEHFRKLKYYRAKKEINPMIAKYIIGAIIVAILVISIYSYPLKNKPQMQATTTPASAAITNHTNIASPGAPGGMFACPMLFYHINGSIDSYSGFLLYMHNSSFGEIPNYVMRANSSGTLIVNESITNVLSEPSNITKRQHYAFLTNIKGDLGTAVQGEGVILKPFPLNFSIAKNESTIFLLNITANDTASGTYWLRIDGPCGGGVMPVLLTIGTEPYNGNITSGSVITYA